MDDDNEIIQSHKLRPLNMHEEEILRGIIYRLNNMLRRHDWNSEMVFMTDGIAPKILVEVKKMLDRSDYNYQDMDTQKLGKHLLIARDSNRYIFIF